MRKLILMRYTSARFAPVAFMFARKGRIRLVPKEGSSWEDVWETAVDGGAEDVSEAEPYSGEIEVHLLSCYIITITQYVNTQMYRLSPLRRC
jgi:transcriptional/translational regulatory protein YebC/TACO1